jgi:cellobiose epimerase
MDEHLNSDILWNTFLQEIADELKNILHYWEQYAVDPVGGGFYGQINSDNQIARDFPKGSVLNSRILWSFSAAYHYTKNLSHLDLATRAYHYIRDQFTDPEYGGLYWSLNAQGTMHDGRKQIYAQAFGIYGMSEYFRISQNPDALKSAIDWYRNIEKYSLDTIYGGYTEAFSRDWSFLKDMRLSEKDKNTAKSMNTHLHIVEAYANLYSVWPDTGLKTAIGNLLNIFDEKIVKKTTHHLGLFFNREWVIQDTSISYGHDIEAAWLLQSCAESINDDYFIAITKKNALLITDAAIKGFAPDGGLWCEFDYKKLELTAEKHWWPQAESLIGLFNAYNLSAKPLYRHLLLKNWSFIKENILDKIHGEWHWGIDQFQQKIPHQYKVGLWKCPYHNIRACLEILKRSGL